MLLEKELEQEVTGIRQRDLSNIDKGLGFGLDECSCVC